MPLDPELKDALEALEAEFDIVPARGMGFLPPSIRYNAVINKLREKICPRSEEILDLTKNKHADVAASLTDAILSFVTSAPLLAATLAKYLVEVGLENFCRDPSVLVVEDD